MAAKSFLHLNQLQFNLNAPPTANNLMYKQRNPEPIKIERLGGQQQNKQTWTPTSHPLDNSVQFSVISEDRLSAAVLLARRDRKYQKMAEQMRANQQKSPPSSPQRGRSRTKITTNKQSILAKRRPGIGKPATKVGNKATVPKSVPQPVSRTNQVNLPVTTNSPPTRDTDRYPIHKVHIPIADNEDEINRMQRELESYLHQIKTIEEKAITDENTEFLTKRRGRSKDGYLSDEENVNRKVTRSEEQLVRSARNLYNLRQQVHQIQKDFLHLGSNDIKQTKKSQALSKLTAAYRGAVRSMQAFVHQLPHQDLRHGLPSSYRELALLIRQLTMLNTQIQRRDDTAANNQLITILDRVDELNQVWCSDIRGHISSKYDQNTRIAPERPPFVLDFNEDKPSKLHQKVYGKENKTRDILSRSLKKDVGMKKSVNHFRSGSPQRKAALRAGVASLLKPNGAGRKPNVAFNIPNRSRPMVKKGLILPGNLQSKREKINRHIQPVISDSHFADPTISTNLKSLTDVCNPITDPRPLSAPSSPSDRHKELGFIPSRHYKVPWIPPGSPLTCGAQSPSGEGRSRSYSPSSSRKYHIEDIDNSVIKRLFADKDGNQLQIRTKRSERFHSPKPRSISPRQHRSRSASPTPSPRRRALSESLIEDIAEEVRRKLKVNAENHDKLFQSYPVASKAKKVLRRSEEDLTDIILDDVLRDTVYDLNQKETRNKIHESALSMVDSSTVENLFYRLSQMEEEQDDIRRRWTSVSFHDSKPRTKYFTKNEVLSDRPRSPPSIEICSSRKPGSITTTNITNTERSIAFSQDFVAEPIIFTKSKETRQWSQSYKRKETFNDDFDHEPLTIPQLSQPKKQVTLAQTIVSKIEDNQETFQRHLKKMSHHPMGKFDPWKLVEEITDKIMDECLLDVALELDDLNEDMANHMYKSEFLLVNDQSPSSAAMSNIEHHETAVITEPVTDHSEEGSHDGEDIYSNDL